MKFILKEYFYNLTVLLSMHYTEILETISTFGCIEFLFQTQFFLLKYSWESFGRKDTNPLFFSKNIFPSFYIFFFPISNIGNSI